MSMTLLLSYAIIFFLVFALIDPLGVLRLAARLRKFIKRMEAREEREERERRKLAQRERGKTREPVTLWSYLVLPVDVLVSVALCPLVLGSEWLVRHLRDIQKELASYLEDLSRFVGLD